MQPAALRISVLIAGALAAAFCLRPQATPSQEPRPGEPQGMPPRATPAEYQAHAQAGAVTIGAEFSGHSFLTPEGTLSTDEFVVVETGLFGAPGARLKLSPEDFSLRVNGKKTPAPGVPYGVVTASVKDPEWAPPEPPKSAKSKTSLDSGQGGNVLAGGAKESPTPIHIPIEVQRGWSQRLQKASLAEGDRALPQAGLIYFLYRGKAKDIHSVELIYSGPAGHATMALQP